MSCNRTAHSKVSLFLTSHSLWYKSHMSDTGTTLFKHIAIQKVEILRTWVQRAQTHIPKTQNLPYTTVLNEIPKVIDRLCFALSSEQQAQVLLQAREIGKEHGEQRAWLARNYTISD